MVKILIFTEVLKDLSSWLLECNATISFQVIPSASDPANLPSHTLCDKDCTLSEYAWVKVAHRFGPHMLDLMSLDSNVQKDAARILLRHFTTHSTLFSAGINVFAQAVSSGDIYIFASFVVVRPLLSFLEAANISSTIKVPQLYPLPFWWLIPGFRASSCIQLGHQWRPQHAPFSVFQKRFYSTPPAVGLVCLHSKHLPICPFLHSPTA